MLVLDERLRIIFLLGAVFTRLQIGGAVEFRQKLLSAEEDPPLVAFLKFHKVAGATVAAVFRNACPDHLPPFYWDYKACPTAPHGHGSLVSYRKKGPAGLTACLEHNSTQQVHLTTILRDPVDRILSALHFFYGGRYTRWAKTDAEKDRSVLLASLDQKHKIDARKERVMARLSSSALPASSSSSSSSKSSSSAGAAAPPPSPRDDADKADKATAAGGGVVQLGVYARAMSRKLTWSTSSRYLPQPALPVDPNRAPPVYPGTSEWSWHPPPTARNASLPSTTTTTTTSLSGATVVPAAAAAALPPPLRFPVHAAATAARPAPPARPEARPSAAAATVAATAAASPSSPRNVAVVSSRTRELATSSSTSSGSGTGMLVNEALIEHLKVESANHWRQPLNQYTDVLARGSGLEETASTDVNKAVNNLRRDFKVVGLTRDVPSFAVLLSIHMKWPLHAVCLYSAHVNSNRTTASMLPSHVLNYIQERVVKHDLAVYEAAEEVHAQHVRAAGREYQERLARFNSDEFKAECAAQRRRRAEERRKLGKGSARVEGC